MTAKTTTASDTDVRAAFTLLADRYEEIAPKAVDDQRAAQIRKDAGDIRHVLTTGRLPRYLATDAELEQYATTERAS